MGILNLELDVYFSEDVYIIQENQPSLPVMLITERPAFVPFDVLVHPILSDFNATGLLFTYQTYSVLKQTFVQQCPQNSYMIFHGHLLESK